MVDELTKNPPDGTSFGQSADDAISFYGETPVAQQSGSDQAAVSTSAATTSSPFGYATSAQANGIVTLLNEIQDVLSTAGLMKGSA